jgi:apolipoprotein N-acyltransferase
MSFSRLRAVENRRSIARSANTGISCFINQRGDVFQQTKWWTPAAIRQEINKNNELTFFSKHGDILGRTSAFGVILIVLLTFYQKLKKLITRS